MEHKKISNPLTMIGVFAGIAEVAGTTVLPFLSEQLQHIFIWYVMGFPILLVVLFFITLWISPSKLYSPDEIGKENFIKLYHKLDEISDTAETVDETTKSAINNSVETAKAYLDNIMYENINNITAPAILPLKFIHLFNENPNGLSSREISEKLKLSQATTHRMLKILKENDLIQEATVSSTVNGATRQIANYSRK